MKKTLFVCAMAVIGCCASSGQNVLFELFRNKTSSAGYNPLSFQAIPQQTQTVVNCTKEHITQLSQLYKPGDEFMCKQDSQEWKCTVRNIGYACNVYDNGKPEASPLTLATLETQIQLTDDQKQWLQENVIQSRKLNLLFRNEDQMKFRQAINRAGTFYLAQGNNGAIYGALTFVNISTYWSRENFYGPGETLIFSVTNKKISKYAGKTGKPISVFLDSRYSKVAFRDGDQSLVSLSFSFNPDRNDGRIFAYSYTEGGSGFQIGRDAQGMNIITGVKDRYDSVIKTLEIYSV